MTRPTRLPAVVATGLLVAPMPGAASGPAQARYAPKIPLSRLQGMFADMPAASAAH